jgi:hypothetical protein
MDLNGLGLSAIPAIAQAIATMGTMWLPESMRNTLTSAGFTGNSFANSLANSLLSQINTFFRCPKLTVELKDGTTLSVLLYCTGYKEKWKNDISEQMLITVEGSQIYATDNFANTPKEWELTGYIMSLTTFQAVAESSSTTAITDWTSFAKGIATAAASISEPSCLYMPSLLKQKKWMSTMQGLRKPITFRDKHQEEYQVGIVNVDWDFDATVQNAYPFSMTLRETPILYVQTNALTSEDLASYQATAAKSTAQASGDSSYDFARDHGKDWSTVTDSQQSFVEEATLYTK